MRRMTQRRERTSIVTNNSLQVGEQRPGGLVVRKMSFLIDISERCSKRCRYVRTPQRKHVGDHKHQVRIVNAHWILSPYPNKKGRVSTSYLSCASQGFENRYLLPYQELPPASCGSRSLIVASASPNHNQSPPSNSNVSNQNSISLLPFLIYCMSPKSPSPQSILSAPTKIP